MNKSVIATQLQRIIGEAEEDGLLEQHDVNILKVAANLLRMSMFTVLSTAYHAGYIDCLSSRESSNEHKHAKRKAEAFALGVIRGQTKGSEVQTEPPL